MQLFNRWNQGQFSGGVLHPSIRSHRSGWTERTWMRAAHLKPALLQTVVLNKRKTVVCMCKNLIYVIYLIRWQLSNNTCASCNVNTPSEDAEWKVQPRPGSLDHVQHVHHSLPHQSDHLHLVECESLTYHPAADFIISIMTESRCITCHISLCHITRWSYWSI